MKKLISFILIMMVAFPVFALTSAERDFLEKLYDEIIVGVHVRNPRILQWVTDNSQYDVKEIVFEGTDVQRKALIKSYLENVEIPELEEDVAQLNQIATNKQSKIDVRQAWVDAN